MCIPFCNKGHQPLRQMLLVRKIGHPQAFALQDREPLLDLIHPRTMDGWKVQHKARVFGQPGLYLLAFVPPYIIEHHMNRRDVRGHLLIDMLQERDEFHLPFPLGRRGGDRTRARIKPGKKVQGTRAGILVFDPHGVARLCGQGGRFTRPGLRLVFSSTHSTISQTPSGRVYKVAISWTCAANAASRGTLGDSHR